MPLTPDLLERLERCWVNQEVPWAKSLLPGVGGAGLDEILAPFGRAIPTELRLWWGWHNGASQDVWIAHNLALMSAEQAMRDFQMMWQIAQDAEDPERFWSRRWLPLFSTSSAPTYAIECAEGEPAEAGLIYYQDSHPNPHTGFIAAASIGDVVHQLCEAYDAGLQRWDHASGRWMTLEPGRRRPVGF